MAAATHAIVGATGAVGRALAQRVVKRGGVPLLIGRSADKLDALAKEHGNAPILVADCADVLVCFGDVRDVRALTAPGTVNAMGLVSASCGVVSLAAEVAQMEVELEVARRLERDVSVVAARVLQLRKTPRTGALGLIRRFCRLFHHKDGANNGGHVNNVNGGAKELRRELEVGAFPTSEAAQAPMLVG